MRLRTRALVAGPLVAAIVFPLYWAVLSSFTPESRLFAAPALVPRATLLRRNAACSVPGTRMSST